VLDIVSSGESVSTVSHLIQLSVAPVFLIAGVGAILGVLSQRLSRIVDRVEKINTNLLQIQNSEGGNRRASDLSEDRINDLKRQRYYLGIRARNMNLAILFCTTTGFLVAAVIMTLFLSSFFEFSGAGIIAGFFIAGMSTFMLALGLFLREIFMATYFMKRRDTALSSDV